MSFATDPEVEEPYRSKFNRQLTLPQQILGGLVATFIFIGGAQLIGGVTSGDASDSINTTWAFAHGIASCAYPPGNQFGLPYIPPVYTLFTGAVSALLRIGHSVPFPNAAQMGPNCSNAVASMYHWSLQSHALEPTLQLGYLTWFILALGAAALLRTSGKGGTIWEPFSLILIAIVPSLLMSLHEYFHPQDIMAVGLILGALAGARQGRWCVAGALIGIACMTQQFALLGAVALVFAVPRERLTRFLLWGAAAVGVIAIPVVLLSSSATLKAVFTGSGTTWNSGTVLDATHLQGPLLFVASRYLPIAASIVLSWWARQKLGNRILDAVPLISLVATSLSFRLVFEVNLWGYYFLAVSVLLVLLDVIRGRIRWSLLLWLALQAIAFRPILGATSSFGPEHTSWLPLWTWQTVLVTGAIALSVSALVTTVRNDDILLSTRVE